MHQPTIKNILSFFEKNMFFVHSLAFLEARSMSTSMFFFKLKFFPLPFSLFINLLSKRKEDSLYIFIRKMKKVTLFFWNYILCFFLFLFRFFYFSLDIIISFLFLISGVNVCARQIKKSSKNKIVSLNNQTQKKISRAHCFSIIIIKKYSKLFYFLRSFEKRKIHMCVWIKKKKKKKKPFKKSPGIYLFITAKFIVFISNNTFLIFISIHNENKSVVFIRLKIIKKK